MGGQFFGVDGVVQADHDLVRAGGIRLHHMRCGGVEDGGVLLQKHHAVQAVGVAGTVDLFNGLALLFCRLGQPLHQGRFAAARPAFDEIHLHPRFPPQRLKITFEPGGRRGPKEKINGIVSKIRHGKHLTFALGYAKQRRSDTAASPGAFPGESTGIPCPPRKRGPTSDTRR